LGALNSKTVAIAADLAVARRDINIVGQSMPAIQTAINRVDQALPAISKNAVSVRSDVQDIKGDLRQLMNNMQRSEERLAALPFIQERIDTLLYSFTSSIMPQLGSHSREQRQLQLRGPECGEILGRIDALVRIQLAFRNEDSVCIGTRNQETTASVH
jgi:hypothetical protein